MGVKGLGLQADVQNTGNYFFHFVVVNFFSSGRGPQHWGLGTAAYDAIGSHSWKTLLKSLQQIPSICSELLILLVITLVQIFCQAFLNNNHLYPTDCLSDHYLLINKTFVNQFCPQSLIGKIAYMWVFGVLTTVLLLLFIQCPNCGSCIEKNGGCNHMVILPSFDVLLFLLHSHRGS